MALVDRLIVMLAGAAAGAVCDRLATRRAVKQLQQQLSATEYRAAHDRLTGLLNRGGLEDAYPTGSDTARWLMIVDLDRFKSVNDQYGHPTGDLVLAAWGSRLRHLLHQTRGTAGRLGGDEFAVVIPQRSGINVNVVAARLVAPIMVDGPGGVTASVTASVGVTAVPPAMTIGQALSQADIALYQAKRRGRPVAYRTGMAYPRLPWMRRHARDHDNATRRAHHDVPQRRRVRRRTVRAGVGRLDYRRRS